MAIMSTKFFIVFLTIMSLEVIQWTAVPWANTKMLLKNGLYTRPNGYGPKLAKLNGYACTDDDPEYPDYEGCALFIDNFGRIFQMKEDEFDLLENNGYRTEFEARRVTQISFYKVRILSQPDDHSLNGATYEILQRNSKPAKSHNLKVADLRDIHNGNLMDFMMNTSKIALSHESIRKYTGISDWHQRDGLSFGIGTRFLFDGFELKEATLALDEPENGVEELKKSKEEQTVLAKKEPAKGKAKQIKLGSKDGKGPNKQFYIIIIALAGFLAIVTLVVLTVCVL